MSYASDVLFMIGAGLAQGKIKAPDIEMMLSDGPKRVPLLELVMQALAEFPQPLAGADAEKIAEPPRVPRTPPSAHPALAAANEWAELTADWDLLPFGTRAYYDALAKCDAAWERIAAACGVLGMGEAQPRVTAQDYREQLECLLEIWDDTQKPEDHRAYISDAWRQEVEHARSLLAHGVDVVHSEVKR